MSAKDVNRQKARMTLRLDPKVYKEVERQAELLGLTKNGFVSMVLHKAINKTG